MIYQNIRIKFNKKTEKFKHEKEILKLYKKIFAQKFMYI